MSSALYKSSLIFFLKAASMMQKVPALQSLTGRQQSVYLYVPTRINVCMTLDWPGVKETIIVFLLPGSEREKAIPFTVLVRGSGKDF
jgi:hypothetical protein